jgi:hypothetical protein
MDHPRSVIARSYEAIKKTAEEFGLPLRWALQRRKEYLTGVMDRNEKVILEQFKKLAGADELYHRLLLNRITEARRKVGRAQFDLKRLRPQVRSNSGLTDDMIERAREYPIDSLLPGPVKHNKALCPFHDDKNPSMQVSGNYAWCFACNRGWNPIDFVMELRGCDFKEAVTYLNEM